jgi:hypothetical protein
MSRKYVFESIDGTLLKQEPLDSFRFIEFCEIEEEDSALSEGSTDIHTGEDVLESN